jgi:hypothetical protein
MQPQRTQRTQRSLCVLCVLSRQSILAVRFARGRPRIMLGAMRIPWPTRRWLQFSLRTLLVFVTLFAIVCSWLSVKLREAKREEEAATAITASALAVEWDKNATGPAWLRGVLGEHFFWHVENVWLQGAEVTDATLQHLDAMSHLKRLNLDAPNVTDSGLEHVQGLRELKGLVLDRTNVTDLGVERIAGLKQLEILGLRGTRFTDAALEKLGGLSNLQSMLLQDANVTDAGLEHLQRMKQLKYVYLFGTQVTASGVKKLQRALPSRGYSLIRPPWRQWRLLTSFPRRLFRRPGFRLPWPRHRRWRSGRARRGFFARRVFAPHQPHGGPARRRRVRQPRGP